MMRLFFFLQIVVFLYSIPVMAASNHDEEVKYQRAHSTAVATNKVDDKVAWEWIEPTYGVKWVMLKEKQNAVEGHRICHSLGMGYPFEGNDHEVRTRNYSKLHKLVYTTVEGEVGINRSLGLPVKENEDFWIQSKTIVSIIGKLGQAPLWPNQKVFDRLCGKALPIFRRDEQNGLIRICDIPRYYTVENKSVQSAPTENLDVKKKVLCVGGSFPTSTGNYILAESGDTIEEARRNVLTLVNKECEKSQKKARLFETLDEYHKYYTSLKIGKEIHVGRYRCE